MGEAGLTHEWLALLESGAVGTRAVHVACTRKEAERGAMNGTPDTSQGGDRYALRLTEGRECAKEVVQG